MLGGLVQKGNEIKELELVHSRPWHTDMNMATLEIQSLKQKVKISPKKYKVQVFLIFINLQYEN